MRKQSIELQASENTRTNCYMLSTSTKSLYRHETTSNPQTLAIPVNTGPVPERQINYSCCEDFANTASEYDSRCVNRLLM